MSYSVIEIIYGVPLTQEVSDKIQEWKEANDDRWYEGSNMSCGFTRRYGASGSDLFGFCGVVLDELPSYTPMNVNNLKLQPAEEQRKKAEELVAYLDPELGDMAGPLGVYFIWSDS